jgi:hypothetical protein
MEFIPLHFDVPDHSLPLDDFITSANSAKAIIENFNKELFEGKLKYRLMVLPPKEGTFLETLGIVLCSGIGVAWAFLLSDIGKAYIKGLTGYEPTHWARQAGEWTKEHLKNDTVQKQQQLEKQKQISIIIVQITLGFFKKEPDTLRKLGVSKDKFRLAYKARNSFYETCIENRDIRAIGFDETAVFPIKRADFPKFIVDVPTEKEDEDNVEWKVETQDIKVHSPDWERDGRNWRAKSSDDKDVGFSVEDDAFWHHVKIKDITPDINDNMKVQWAFPSELGRRSHLKVLRVLSYNGKKLADPLLPEDLEKILQKFSYEEKNQKDLFDQVTQK